MIAHAIHSASSSNRWTKCAASIRMSLGLDNPSNPAAALGTAAHELGEFCLRLGLTTYECIGMVFNAHVVDALMADAVQLYVSYIRDLCRKHNVNPMLEKRVVMTSVGSDVFGTSDCIVIIGDWLFVIDYKHGYGVVEVKDNSQATFYTVATLDTFQLWDSIKYVHTAIVQPRADHVDGAIRSHVYPVEALVHWQRFFKEAVAASKREDSTFVAGTHCKYCLARSFCRTRVLRTLEMAFFDKPVDKLTVEEIAVVYNEIGNIKTNTEAVAAKALELARVGETIGGNKLVRSTPKRTCTDEKSFIEAAVNSGVDITKITKKKLTTLAQIDKAVSEEIVTKYFVAPPASTTLVDISSARAAVSLIKPKTSGKPSANFAPVPQGK